MTRMEDGQAHRKLKGKGKGKGNGAQRCLDISGDWLVLDPLTTYYNDDTPTAHVSVVFRFAQSDSNTPCNYFGQEYFVNVDDTTPEIAFQHYVAVALTNFPGYMGAMEGDKQFLSLAGQGDAYAPGNVQVCKCGNTAKIFRDAKCFGDNTCDSKNVMYMVRFPEPVEIVGHTHSELVKELIEQTGRDILSFTF
ncbi:hypothetical protein TrRE_jg9267 [Triparma retinervis]|uniref:Uncharacterized protein n=1 Tax=Triparma retinervis TaxID=2557542 RepID=A0A9W7AN29_9STRA|nr:hypothetical protein TrRE_jg9267 [Triparma retinervis]